jgi:DNA-3-methyladenine glycosylase I
MAEPTRCSWAAGTDAAMQAYHDTEWGVPQHDDRTLFEFLTLEGAQAGLSWRTILARRTGYRVAFHDFDIDRVASTRGNARAAQAVIARHGSLDAFLWSFVDGHPIINRWTVGAQVPATTPASDRMSKELKKQGFRFVGSTICYAFMQATGMVNDHLVSCFRYGR